MIILFEKSESMWEIRNTIPFLGVSEKLVYAEEEIRMLGWGQAVSVIAALLSFEQFWRVGLFAKPVESEILNARWRTN